MSFQVKELFLSLQGEGANVGRVAVFCRFSGCNLWSGRLEDRAGAVCKFCDTDFIGTNESDGGVFPSARGLLEAALALWPREAVPSAQPMVVFTGGEPLLQVDSSLISAFRKAGFYLAVETNGTLPIPPGIDWVTVSPKAGTPLVATSGSELKLVFPQTGLDPRSLASLDFRHFFLQPMAGPDLAEHTRRAALYCLENPRWRLSVQMHKFANIR
jgi:7-carboxy-7-deazaguanine synthase (Cx14CxxC type)